MLNANPASLPPPHPLPPLLAMRSDDFPADAVQGRRLLDKLMKTLVHHPSLKNNPLSAQLHID